MAEDPERGLDARIARLETLGEADHGPTDALAVEIAEALLSETAWGDRQDRFCDVLAARSRHGLAHRFAAAWMERHGARAQALFQLGGALFLDGHYGEAWKVYRTLWAAKPEFFRPALGDLPAALLRSSDEAEARILDRIEAMQADFAADPSNYRPWPLAVPAAAAPRFLYLGFAALGPGMENDLLAHFRDSAAESGVPFDAFAEDALFIPGAAAEEGAAAHERLRRRLARPDFDAVIVEVHHRGMAWALTPDLLVSALAPRPVPIVALFRDSVEPTRYLDPPWAAIARLCLVFDPQAILFQSEYRDRVRAIPLPLPTSRFHPGAGARPREIGFAGAANFYGRKMLLSALLASDLGLDFVDARRRRIETRTSDAYAAYLRSCRATINIAAHGIVEDSAGAKNITGRIFEATACGALLLEQANESTARLFVPYVHYLPWQDLTELAALMSLVRRRPELAGRIAQAGSDWQRRHYGPAQVWGAIRAGIE